MIPGLRQARRHQPRHGTDLAATGRTTLPGLGRAPAQSRQRDPARNRLRPGRRHRRPARATTSRTTTTSATSGNAPGADFDLNDTDVRFCVTPEFPAGTWAYFLTIEADGTPGVSRSSPAAGSYRTLPRAET